MSDAVQIVTVICGVITALGVPYIAYLMAVLNQKQTDAAREAEIVKNTLNISNKTTENRLNSVMEKIEIVHKATNSIKDELVASTDKAARAEGHAAGLLEQQTRQNKV